MSSLSPAEERNEVPDEKIKNEDSDKTKFKFRHNFPYRRQPHPGDYGIRRSTTPTTTSTTTTAAEQHYHSNFGYQPVESKTESPREAAVNFVTMPHDNTENATNIARQPKKADDFGSDSKIHEIRVLPPEEFHHLLAKVDGVDRKVISPN